MNLYGMVSNNVLNSWDVLGYENVLGQIPGAPTGITWWHLEQEMKHKAKMPNSNFWYCERLLDSSDLSKAKQWSVRISTVQHAYVSVGPHPWSPQNGLRGYGFSGQAQKPGTYPLPESAFNPTRCRPCYKRTDTKSQLQHGADKGTCCKDATDKQIENCISSAPIKREYSVNLFNLYVCWTWAEETLNECCLNCNNTFVKEGQFK